MMTTAPPDDHCCQRRRSHPDGAAARRDPAPGTEMATLAEIGNDIAASRDLEPVLKRIAAHAKEILRVRDIAIVLREPDSQTFRTAVALGQLCRSDDGR
jgi:hypothetical protein